MLRRLFRLSGTRDASADAAVASTQARMATAVRAPVEASPEAAVELAASGFYAESLAIIDAALAAVPGDPDWICARGWTLFDWARFKEARPWLLKAVASGLDRPHLHLRAGWACMWTTGAQGAEEWMRRAVAGAPNDWTGHFGLGSSLRAQGRIDEAVASFGRAMDLSPENPDCLAQLFDCRYAQNRLAEAEAYARRVVEIDPGSVRGWINLGVALITQDRFGEAIEAFEHAESCGKATGEVDRHLNLAICLRETGRLPDALGLYERELPKRPSVGAHAHYGHALLTAGRLPEGFAHYEFRWLQDPLLSLRPSYRKPLWAGQDLRGKTILLRSEQGIVDFIQFIRYAPQVKALGGTVLLQLRKNIRELAQSFPGIDRILDGGEPVPEFDYYIHLMSLPRVFDTDLASIPAEVPYLRAEPQRIDRWTERFRGGLSLKVGLVWAGDPGHLRDRYRSIPLAQLAPLWRVDGVRIFSLQKGAQAAEASAASAGQPMVDLGADLRDFADTAAVISLLDLVICVDTSVAHLAGALGKPAWVLVPTPADWRWMEGREDSPWYPTMRLFRQVRPGEWDDVIQRVAAALEDLAAQPRGDGAVQAAPALPPAASPRAPSDGSSLRTRTGLSAVAETRMGILQYWPQEFPAGTSIERYGEYLQLQLDAVARWIEPDSTIVEVAPGIGIHSLFLASAIGPGGHLMLYEDDLLRRQVLAQNLQANRLANWTLMKRRLGSRSAKADAPVALRPVAVPAPDVETIDDLRLEILHWIKVGDGAVAMAALEGAADTLWRLRPKLWLAAANDDELRGLAARVRDCGYQCFRMETPLFSPRNFNGCAVDVFDGRRARALLAIPEETVIDIALDHCTVI